MRKLRVTQSLLSSWEWSYKKEGGMEEFLRTLRREKSPPTNAMLDGIKFENIINAALDGAQIDTNTDWYGQISKIVPYLQGAQKQVTLFRDLDVQGVPFLLHGVLDFLRAGIIYDTKLSKTYRVGKYLDSPQHPMYFALVPEAYEFQYIVCDGRQTYLEKYRPADCTPIETTVKQFMGFLETHNLIEIYAENWEVKQ